MHESSNRWALILAAGSGTRLAGLTADGSGASVPKQFCSLAGGASLLEETLARAASIAPAAQTVVVVAEEHRRFWQGALAHAEPETVIAQPRNRGTANGILLGLCAIAERDPAAIVAILPSDHYVEREDVLERALAEALEAIDESTGQAVTFLGVAPEAADPELGYIVPGPRRAGGSRRIARFVEKPTRAIAARLVRRGALWNSFIIVARASALLELIAERCGEQVAAFGRVWRRAGLTNPVQVELTRLYEQLPEIDFSRHVVEGARAALGVVEVPRCGWSDLGTPQRVAAALARLDRVPVRAIVPRGEQVADLTRPFNLAEAYSRLMSRLGSGAAQTV